jgi:preprotein translocase subunit SecB
MSTPATPLPTQPTQENAPVFQIQRIYVKGISLEAPNAPAIFLEQGEVQIKFDLRMERSDLQGDSKEVRLRATVEAKLGEKNVFLLEIDQAGIFELKNLTTEQAEQILEVNCPTILTPYLRSQISSILLNASMPQFMLPEFNWAGAYLERQQQKAAGQTLQ